jgi:hypothetical protein
MISKLKGLILFFALLNLLTFNSVLAQLPGLISVGMSPSDVIKLRGAPLEKDEHETSRKIIWKYKDGVVVFLNGKVVNTKSKSYKKTYNNQPIVKKSRAKKGTGEELSQKEVDDIIAAIPNDTGKPAGNTATGGASSQ